MPSTRPPTEKTSIIKMCPTRNHSTSSETLFATRNNNDVNDPSCIYIHTCIFGCKLIELL